MPESDPLRFDPIVSSERFDELRASRGAVYGDPKENHSLIAGQWAAILQPWGKHISEGKPLPPHVIALCMVGLKLNRMRLSFHRDNYEDLGVYASMAMKWQQEWDEAQSQEKNSPPMRKYSGKFRVPWRMFDDSYESLPSRKVELSEINTVLAMNKGAEGLKDISTIIVKRDYFDADEKSSGPSVYNWHRYAAQRGMTE